MHVLGQTGQFLLAAVPIAALLAAYSWRQALSTAVGCLASWPRWRWSASSVLQRLAVGRAPSLDQFVNGVIFLQLTALNACRAAGGDAGHRAAARTRSGPDDVRRPAGVQPGAARRIAADPRAGDDRSWRRAGAERGPDGRVHPAGAADRLGSVAVPGGDGARVRDQAPVGQRAAGQRVVGDVRVRLRGSTT